MKEKKSFSGEVKTGGGYYYSMKLSKNEVGKRRADGCHWK
jgi:hypothetical protein